MPFIVSQIQNNKQMAYYTLFKKRKERLKIKCFDSLMLDKDRDLEL